MADLILPRRKFLAGIGALLAAPAIVRASSLMPVRATDLRYLCGRLHHADIAADDVFLVTISHPSTFTDLQYTSLTLEAMERWDIDIDAEPQPRKIKIRRGYVETDR